MSSAYLVIEGLISITTGSGSFKVSQAVVFTRAIVVYALVHVVGWLERSV